MSDSPPLEAPADGLDLPWAWCMTCQRTYLAGLYREVVFAPDRFHPRPAVLKLCPYQDCNGSASRQRWRWTTIRLQHAEYPLVPEHNVVYAV